LCFLSIVISSVLFLSYLAVDFFAAVILLIYAGAIVVLLLFIIMFIQFDEKNIIQPKYSRLFLLICLFSCTLIQKIFVQLFSDELIKMFIDNTNDLNYNDITLFNSLIPTKITHISQLAELYTTYYLVIILLGVALLLAMFGAIYLTRYKSRY
jgi:NADH:ubiquinone oxidoreductase subunit 6 (subunit J)